MLYQKKPVPVSAFCWDPTDDSDVPDWARQAMFEGRIVRSWAAKVPTLSINTLEGWMTATAGYYIIQGVKGEIYACAPGVFNETYEPYPTEQF